MKKTGINMEGVKKQNRSLILHTINRMGPMSRKDLASITHLTPASITMISNSLLSDGLLEEAGTVKGEGGMAGRHKILLDINGEKHLTLTVNIEAEETTIALCDCKGRLAGDVSVKTIKTDRKLEPELFLRRIAGICREITEIQPEDVREKIAFLSVGISGIVDRERKISVHAYGVWDREVEVGRIMEEELGLEVLLFNNVEALALGELLFGIGRTYDNLLLIKWGPGVGSTIVINGQIYEGRHGKSAELGHYIVDRNGRRCNCGRTGCLETVVSYKALRELLDFPMNAFEDAFSSTDEETKKALREKIDLFARCIVNTATILAPNRIVLCGKLFGGETIRKELISACQSYDKGFNERRILYTGLCDREAYIG
ncbi:MAG: ROK family transcriptional regulator, partial [Erysipelotrichaceae bacterium]|nr:ROK family transcriptional regulator [Erysipelotrichaceae bacterium]